MSKTKFPITIKTGNVRVKIYSTPSNGCEAYTVAYYFGGKRVRKMFSDLALAKTEAQTIANATANGEINVLTLTNEDRSAYVRSMEMLKPTGTPLEIAVMQFAEASKLLGGLSLLEAAKFYMRQNPSQVTVRTVSQVVEEMIASKEAEGMSEVHIRDMRSRLRQFATKFKTPIAMVMAPEMQSYITNRKCSGRTKNNIRKLLMNLFHFAQKRGYLPKGTTEADSLSLVKETPRPIGIYTPEVVAKFLAHAEEDLIAFLAIGAFAGLRHAEILRLDWSEVDLESGLIEVKAAKSKTASRRLVPISANLKKWLTPRHKKSGFVVPFQQMGKRMQKLKKATNLDWKHNALRHSYISYRVAETQNVAQTSLEAGNSPRVIFSNYRELVKPAEAVKWFAIEPHTPAEAISA